VCVCVLPVRSSVCVTREVLCVFVCVCVCVCESATKPVIRVTFSKLRFMHHLKAELIIFPLMYGLDNICKSGI